MLIYLVTVNSVRLAFFNEEDAFHYARNTFEYFLRNENDLSEDDKEALYQRCKNDLLRFFPFETEDGFSARIEVLPLIGE
ncbi:MAG: hypothetical protein LUC37_02740 [Prevotella sp.]|nr:hypothetical protein [Prevotella sp.]